MVGFGCNSYSNVNLLPNVNSNIYLKYGENRGWLWLSYGLHDYRRYEFELLPRHN